MAYRSKKNELLEKIIERYKLEDADKERLLKIILPIYNHKEFQKRLTQEFCHHGNITLGEHIICDAIQTYIYSKKYLENHNNLGFELEIAVKIAMFHDLYTYPWQNNKKNKAKKFFNSHGFRHPLEAAINAYRWFPEYFEHVNDARKIIDGIVHHMYPLPVCVFSDLKSNPRELSNYKYIENFPDYIINIIKRSTSHGKIGSLSFSKCNFIEGRIVSKADKHVSIRQIRNISSATALLTGHNRSLIK